MNAKTEKKLQRIKRKILKNTNARKIILFGSYAHDTQKPESDLDICIITEDTKRKKEILRDIRLYMFVPSERFKYTNFGLKKQKTCHNKQKRRRYLQIINSLLLEIIGIKTEN